MRKSLRLIILGLACFVVTVAYASAHGQQESQKQSSSASTKKIIIRVWDQFKPLKAANEHVFAEFEKAHPNVKIEHTIYNPAKAAQALELAFKSGTLPDLTINLTGVPTAALIHAGWFVPIDKYVNVRKNKLVAKNLYPGMEVFNGHVYSVPIQSLRWSNSIWYNKALLKKVGITSSSQLSTYAQVEKAAKEITQQGGGSQYGIVLPIKFVQRMTNIINEFAEAAGSAGPINWKTGAYEYNSPQYVQVIKFLLAFKKQGSLYPSSINIDARQARARWAAGNIGMFPDGPWNAGSIKGYFSNFVPNVGVAWVPKPSASSPGTVYATPPNASYFLTSQSKHPKLAAQFFKYIITQSYYRDLAKAQDQPPLDLGAISQVSGVLPSYKKINSIYAKHVLIEPVPQIRNPAVSDVLANMTEVHPNLGEILQGVFSGQVTNIKGALEAYNQAMTNARKQAIQAVQAKGKEVSVNDWVFPNWNPKKDYTPSMYKALGQ